jgi:hypothetical protein
MTRRPRFLVAIDGTACAEGRGTVKLTYGSIAPTPPGPGEPMAVLLTCELDAGGDR